MEQLVGWIETFQDNAVLMFLIIFGLGVANVFLPPVPLESVTVLCSYWAGKENGSTFVVFSAATIGMSVGSILMYYLAKNRGRRLLKYKFVRSQLHRKYIAKCRIWFGRFGIWTILIGKLLPGISFAVIFCCGLFKVPQRPALTAIFLSNLVYFGILSYVSRYIGRSWEQVTQMFDAGLFWSIGVLLLIGAILFYYFTFTTGCVLRGKR